MLNKLESYGFGLSHKVCDILPTIEFVAALADDITDYYDHSVGKHLYDPIKGVHSKIVPYISTQNVMSRIQYITSGQYSIQVLHPPGLQMRLPKEIKLVPYQSLLDLSSREITIGSVFNTVNDVAKKYIKSVAEAAFRFVLSCARNHETIEIERTDQADIYVALAFLNDDDSRMYKIDNLIGSAHEDLLRPDYFLSAKQLDCIFNEGIASLKGVLTKKLDIRFVDTTTDLINKYEFLGLDSSSSSSVYMTRTSKLLTVSELEGVQKESAIGLKKGYGIHPFGTTKARIISFKKNVSDQTQP